MFKKLILIWLIISVTACSFHKNKQKKNTFNKNNNNIVTENVNNNIHLKAQKELLNYDPKYNNIIYFSPYKCNIEPEYNQILDIHINYLLNNQSRKLTIEGHTDEQGTPEYNISLGERRANIIKIYFQAKGISAERISIISYGEEKPAMLGHDESSYYKNRRAVLIY